MLSLAQQRSRSSIAFGSKSANLGEVLNARLRGIIVPNGFTVPFHYYNQFMVLNKLDDVIYTMLNDQKFVHDPVYRRQQLTILRDRIQKATTISWPATSRSVCAVNIQTKGCLCAARQTPRICRFSGAGLYTTVPNVKDARQLIEAIKTVWASLWNFEAYEARERAVIDHSKVYMAVLLQGVSILKVLV